MLGCGGLIGIVVVIIVIAAVLAATHNGTRTGTAPGLSSATSTGRTGGTARQAGIGNPVRDGKFQFTITRVTRAKKVGGQFGQTAAGKFTVLHLIVTNIGTTAETLDDSAQYVFDATGRKFSADSGADIFANGGGNGNSVFLNQINPGESVHGEIVFDLPKGTRAMRAELHDSAFSGGVTASLR